MTYNERIDQLLICSMTAYALVYIEQIDLIKTMTRQQVIANINDLYGFDDTPPGDISDKFLSYMLEEQITDDWSPDEKLWSEVVYWRNKNARTENNNDAQYGGEWSEHA